MTLDEAIEHAIQIADSYKGTAPDCDCARDHRQLAEWLIKVRVYEKAKKRSASTIRKLKEENDRLRWKLEVLKAHGIEIVDAVAGGYEIYSDDHKEAERLTTENAKLSTQLTDVTESMGRVEERCAKLRAERDEWHRVAVSKQDIIDHMRDARGENAKLRELVRDWYELAVGGADSLTDWNHAQADLEQRMRELGIEVDDGKTDHV